VNKNKKQKKNRISERVLEGKRWTFVLCENSAEVKKAIISNCMASKARTTGGFL